MDGPEWALGGIWNRRLVGHAADWAQLPFFLPDVRQPTGPCCPHRPFLISPARPCRPPGPGRHPAAVLRRDAPGRLAPGHLCPHGRRGWGGMGRDRGKQGLHRGLRSTSSEDHRPPVIRTEGGGWEASQGAWPGLFSLGRLTGSCPWQEGKHLSCLPSWPSAGSVSTVRGAIPPSAPAARTCSPTHTVRPEESSVGLGVSAPLKVEPCWRAVGPQRHCPLLRRGCGLRRPGFRPPLPRVTCTGRVLLQLALGSLVLAHFTL